MPANPKRITEARCEMSRTQYAYEISKHLPKAVSAFTVGRWEVGKGKPSVEQLEAISQATGRPLSFFLDVGEVNRELVGAASASENAEKPNKNGRQ